MTPITSIHALEIIDSRGNPTLSVTVTAGAISGTASVPSGASTGIHEAVELRDGDPKRYNGKGVLKAINNVHTLIAPRLVGHELSAQVEIDQLMIALDGTPNKAHLGANAMLGVSLAVARAAAAARQLPLYRCLGDKVILPTPMLNIINGGAHADSGLAFQEFMIVPHITPFREALRAGCEVYHALRLLLKEQGHSTSVGDEGGFAPRLGSHEEALQLIVEAITRAHYTPGRDIDIALDCAASGFFDDGKYQKRTTADQIAYLQGLVKNYPISSIEDGLAEDDWEGWRALTAALPHTKLIGDDIFVTNPTRLQRGIDSHTANAILIKPNQIGTLTETLNVIGQAQANGYATVISHRSGETDDSFIADLAVATGANGIKTGAPCRGERTAKYNRLLAIEATA